MLFHSESQQSPIEIRLQHATPTQRVEIMDSSLQRIQSLYPAVLTNEILQLCPYYELSADFGSISITVIHTAALVGGGPELIISCTRHDGVHCASLNIGALSEEEFYSDVWFNPPKVAPQDISYTNRRSPDGRRLYCPIPHAAHVLLVHQVAKALERTFVPTTPQTV